MSVPQANATITAVSEASAATGGRDDWDEAPSAPPNDGAAKWSGEERAYLLETTRRVYDGLKGDVVVERALILTSATARQIGIDTDDVITYARDGGSSETGRAAAIRISELDGVDADLQTARLELEPA